MQVLLSGKNIIYFENWIIIFCIILKPVQFCEQWFYISLIRHLKYGSLSLS